MDELRVVNGLTAQVGRKEGTRPASRIETDMEDGGAGVDYHPNEWRDEAEPATTRVRRRKGGGGSSADDTPSPLQQELDRMRTVGETNTVDTKSLRGKKYYSGETSNAIRKAVDPLQPIPNESMAVDGDATLPSDPLDPDQ